MLKITGRHEREQNFMMLLLEGRLAGPWVKELQTSWDKLSAKERHRTMIDLTGVTFIDAGGKALLSRLWQEGAELRAAGCLTKCVVEEITGVRRTDPSSTNHDR